MTDDEVSKILDKLAYSIQIGVAMDHANGSKDGSPKNLRAGVNISLVESSALASILIDKGIITKADWFTYLINAYKAEVARYESRLSDEAGSPIKLS